MTFVYKTGSISAALNASRIKWTHCMVESFYMCECFNHAFIVRYFYVSESFFFSIFQLHRTKAYAQNEVLCAIKSISAYFMPSFLYFVVTATRCIKDHLVCILDSRLSILRLYKEQLSFSLSVLCSRRSVLSKVGCRVALYNAFYCTLVFSTCNFG